MSVILVCGRCGHSGEAGKDVARTFYRDDYKELCAACRDALASPTPEPDPDREAERRARLKAAIDNMVRPRGFRVRRDDER